MLADPSPSSRYDRGLDLGDMGAGKGRWREGGREVGGTMATCRRVAGSGSDGSGSCGSRLMEGESRQQVVGAAMAE